MYNFTDYIFNNTAPVSVVVGGQDYIVWLLVIIAACQVFNTVLRLYYLFFSDERRKI